MNTATAKRNTCSPTRRPRADAAIVFGSVAPGPTRKPASVKATCEAIGLARSTYYYQSNRSDSAIEFEYKIVLRLHELRACHPSDGYRRMTSRLQLEGFHVNRKRVARLLQLHSLTAIPTRPGTRTPRCLQRRSTIENLLRAARLTGPHQAWLADISFVRIRSSLVYAAAIIDVWSREVVGYAVCRQISNRLPSIALHSAARAHRPMPGCIHHSSCGTQYLMRGYRILLRELGLTPSLGDVADRPVLPSTEGSGTSFTHQVVEMQTYDRWDDVIHHAREFIQALYSQERLDLILGR